jgi:hypothetical protein
MARNANGSIQAAINSAPVGPVQVYLSCGIYTENIVISTSDVRLLGEERACVQIQPANPALPVITLSAANGAIDFDEVSDLTINCPTGVTCSDGLRITGGADVAQLNDFHKFERLGVYGAFQNGINLLGRTIWTVFENIEVGGATNNGINVASGGTTNELTFRNVRAAHNNNYGIYVNNTQVNLANGIIFDEVNAEYNGQNTSLANCAGIYLTGVSQANIQNSYFEGNCLGNTADNRAAEIRLTGIYAQEVNITGSVFNLQYGEGGIYNDAVLTTGNYSGDRFDTTTNNFTMYIATTHPLSNIEIGENFNTTPTIIPDTNGITHVRMLSPLGLDYVPITSVTGNSVDVSAINGAILYYGPYTINNFTGGHIGQLLYVTAFNVGGHVLTNSAGGVGQIVFSDGLNRTLQVGEGLLLYYDGNNWHPVESTVTAQARYTATITTTNERFDTVAMPGLTETAHCVYSARNATASLLTGTYLTTGNGTVTLSHGPGNSPFGPYAPAGGIFDVFCSSN